MQMSIHYREEDQYLVDMLEKEAKRHRKSKSAMLLTIIEEYFEAKQKLGEILRDMGAVKKEELKQALELQKTEKNGEKIGEIMLDEGYVEEVQLDRALTVQSSPGRVTIQKNEK